MLQLFDCISCDKCVPVCPNDANFTFVLPRVPIPIVKVHKDGGTWRWSAEGSITIDERHQIGNFADFCNDCGNCDVFCPEDGGPYLLKPRIFGSADAWRAEPQLDGFYLERTADGEHVLGRFAGSEYQLDVCGEAVAFAGHGFAITFVESNPEGTLQGEAAGTRRSDLLRNHERVTPGAWLGPTVNYVNARVAENLRMVDARGPRSLGWRISTRPTW